MQSYYDTWLSDPSVYEFIYFMFPPCASVDHPYYKLKQLNWCPPLVIQILNLLLVMTDDNNDEAEVCINAEEDDQEFSNTEEWLINTIFIV